MNTTSPGGEGGTERPRLKRVLGKWDLVLLFVVAVANLNIVPAIASAGPMTIWLWMFALFFFFWPQGAAVTELSQCWPGEGGVYLWTRESFGHHHAFLAGWCYWLANVLYLPTVLLSCVGVAVYMGGASLQKLTTNAWFAGSVALALLGILYVMNLRGLSLSKWLNDLGGVGTIVGTLALCALSYFTIRRHGSLLRISDFTAPSNDWHLITAFGTICYSLIGLDLASVMGDEIRNPKRDLPGAVLIGGLLSGFIYVSATASLLVAVPKERIGVLEGILQGVSSMAEGIGLTNFIPVVALLMAVAILGTASAWFGGAARLPFVAGLDRYLPSSFGELHPVYGTPYVSLNVFAVISCLLIVVSLLGGTVAEGFLVLLNLASALLLISFGYVFAALLKRALDQTQPVFANRTYLIVNALSGLLCSCIGICVAFIPSSQVTLLWLYEFKLLFGTAVIFGAAYYFYRRAASSGNQGMPRIPRRA